jgi:ATPase subunit of ABC transporter with duplicated ATPase domains
MFNSTYTYIMQRNYSRREVEIKQEKQEEMRAAMKEKKKQMARDAKNTKNVSADSSRPSQSNVTQQPSEEAQAPPTPEPRPIGVPTSSTTSVVAVNSGGTEHWTRFWSAACCTSTQNADGHH